MIAALLLAIMSQAGAAAPPEGDGGEIVKPVIVPPVDWSTLAPFPYRTPPAIAPQMIAYVGGEVKAGRCAQPRSVDGHYHVALDVAVLLAPDGTVRKATPRAINCPTVEQYGAGLVTVFARDNLQQRRAATDQWYRTTLTFDW